jgi:hypothetical protein
LRQIKCARRASETLGQIGGHTVRAILAYSSEIAMDRKMLLLGLLGMSLLARW